MIDYRPWLFLAAMPILLILAWLIRRNAFPARSYLRIFGWTLLAFVGLFWFFLHGPFIGRTETRTYQMQWAIGEPAPEYPGETHVIFTFVDYPNHFTGIFSSGIAGYLSNTNRNPIDVTFRVTRDYGRMRGNTAVRIGNLVIYRYSGDPGSALDGDFTLQRPPVWSYAGTRGEESPSPWKGSGT